MIFRVCAIIIIVMISSSPAWFSALVIASLIALFVPGTKRSEYDTSPVKTLSYDKLKSFALAFVIAYSVLYFANAPQMGKPTLSLTDPVLENIDVGDPNF